MSASLSRYSHFLDQFPYKASVEVEEENSHINWAKERFGTAATTNAPDYSWTYSAIYSYNRGRLTFYFKNQDDHAEFILARC